MATIISPGLYQTSNGSYSKSSTGPGSSGSGGSTTISTNKSNSSTNTNSNGYYKTYVSPESAYIASNTAGLAGSLPNEYGDLIREALNIAENNTAQSQAFAREQMDYQSKSDATAMAWSAQEAEKNRQWQEELANTAHQRQVNDLVNAGLNPILSANNGAYTGSGATGQAFSSSGAQGTVDTTASGILGNLVNTMMNTASQAAIAGIYTDAQKYQADLNYSASMAGIEAGIANTTMSSNATMSAAAMSSAAQRYSADASKENALASAEASKYGYDLSHQNALISADASKYASDKQESIAEYNTKHSATKDPVGYAYNIGKTIANSEPYHNVLKFLSSDPGYYSQYVGLKGNVHGGSNRKF